MHQAPEVHVPEVLTGLISHTAGFNARRQAEILAGAFIAGYSNQRTQRSYRLDLRMWFAFLDDAGIDPVQAHRSHLELWNRMAEARGLAPGTVARRMSTIQTFYRWLADEDVLVKSPMGSARRPKVPRQSSREWMTRFELHRWVDVAEEEGGDTYVLACLLAFNGLRISEACGINVEDMWSESYLHFARIMGKGSKPDDVVLPPRTMVAIDAALSGRTTGPLLLNTTGTRMQRDAAGRIVRRLARRAGITKNITPHSIRHSAISALLDSGAPIRDVQHFARHEDPKTTSRYDRTGRKPERSLSFTAMQYIGGAG